ncbi:hypothetical protein [Brassicibacter mesophilus]|uniref:hypothetical protein n=1 Tax=Brassicibacter mesophilus TaxID=745119 RepID=UPI003D1DEBBF
MNELVPAPENPIVPARSNNLFNSKYILFIPLFFILSNTVKKSSVTDNAFSDILYKLPSLLDFENLGGKIEILKKIGPYLPETSVGTINTVIVSLDRVNKVIGLMDVVSANKVQKPIATVDNLSNKERISHILTIIQEEMPEDKIKNIRPILDIALNFDKYKTIINMMSTLTSTSSSSNKSEKQSNQSDQNNEINRNMQLENMLDAIKPMLGEDADKSMDKAKEMMKMFEMINVLNTPDKEKSEK